jgi:hypothetical protein
LEKIVKLFDNIKGLNKPNKELVVDVFYDVVRLLKKKEERTHKTQFAKDEVITAINVIYDLYSKKQVWDMGLLGNKHLYDFFFDPDDCIKEKKDHEAEALKYYEANLMKKEVKDRYGRRIIFTEEGIGHLYKDPITGKHDIKPENFVTWRKKRMPWLHHTLEHTYKVYERTSPIKEIPIRFLYTSDFKYTYTNDKGIKEDKYERFLVIVTQTSEGLKFETAYALDHDELIKYLEPCRVFKPI